MHAVPAPAPPALPRGNSIKIRCCVFAIGLVYAVAAYMSNSTSPRAQQLLYMPAYAMFNAVLTDRRRAYNGPYLLNLVIMGYTYFVSVMSHLEFVYYTYISPSDRYDIDHMWHVVWLGMAFFSSWARKVLWVAQEFAVD
uniref:Cas1_AcylT domain-containing protein n=1 Tax=Panagrellus redivivus TaxID=6233 RepID=A0A7E4V143_PANRE